MICSQDIKPKAIDWLWSDRFALGKISMIAGMPGLGKSQLTCHMASVVSRGGEWPNNEGRAPEGTVILLSAEDDAADTLVPRLMAAGADRSSVQIIKAVKEPVKNGHDAEERQFNIVDDIKKLCAAIEYLGDVKLVVIDPITAYLGDDKKTDSHKNASVRAALAPLQALAEEHGFACILVSHLNKGGGQEALTLVLGSIGFVAAARASYLVVGEPETERVLFLPMKNNVGAPRPGLAFTKVVKLVAGDDNERGERPNNRHLRKPAPFLWRC
jgi:putative DNA primase/helicase